MPRQSEPTEYERDLSNLAEEIGSLGSPLEPKESRLPKLLVIGHADHGKDTVGEMLTHYGFRVQSSSQACTELVMMPAFKRFLGYQPYVTPEACHADREHHRQFWYEEISNFNEEEGFSRLSEIILKDHDVYLGMRNRREFEASKTLYDHIVWVDASKRRPPESSDSMDLNEFDADWTIDNNHSLNGLALQLSLFMNTIGLARRD